MERLISVCFFMMGAINESGVVNVGKAKYMKLFGALHILLESQLCVYLNGDYKSGCGEMCFLLYITRGKTTVS